MPEISVGSQIFDVVFHPTFATVYTGLLTGYVKAFAYDEQGNHKNVFSLRPSKRSCRGLSVNEDGSQLYSVGKSKALHIIDTKTEQIETRASVHESAINRVKHLTSWLLTTGDDEGVIKLWDLRQQEAARTYTQHFDYISDFLWLEDKKQLVATSADGTLSVMDVRSKKSKPIAHSEDQEDELLSIVAIKGASKIIVGTQLGILSVFNRNSGWRDCVDRIPGHPLSIDALCNLPADLPGIDTTSTILTGSSDGFVRAVQILPTKLLGVVADHGDWPVERIAVGSGMAHLSIDAQDVDDEEDTETIQGAQTRTKKARQQKHGVDGFDGTQDSDAVTSCRWWAGSAGHEDGLRLTDLTSFFCERDDETGKGILGVRDESDLENGGSDDDSVAEEQKFSDTIVAQRSVDEERNKEQNKEQKQEHQSTTRPPGKQKRKYEEDISKSKKKKGKKNAVVVEDASFFGDL